MLYTDTKVGGGDRPSPKPKMSRTNGVAAEVSIHYDGRVYIGVKAKEKLGIGYNDRVHVTIPRENSPDITASGCLTKADTIGAGSDTYRMVSDKNEESHGTTKHVDAIVEPQSRTWDEAHGLTEVRWDGYNILDAKDI